MKTKSRHLLFCCALWVNSYAPAHAEYSLAADDPPGEQPWKQPATVSYVRQGDGKSSGTVDAVFRFKSLKIDEGGAAPSQSNWAYGFYWHKDTDSDSKRNDRGVDLSYSRLIFRDGDASDSVQSLSWKVKTSVGRGLQ